jgi:hypothetical protein
MSANLARSNIYSERMFAAATMVDLRGVSGAWLSKFFLIPGCSREHRGASTAARAPVAEPHDEHKAIDRMMR